MKMVSQKFVIRFLSMMCSVWLGSCGPWESKDSQKEESKQENQTTEDYSYQYIENGCDTGKQSFTDKQALCSALLDNAANNNCAYSLRFEHFNRACKGSGEGVKNTSENKGQEASMRKKDESNDDGDKENDNLDQDKLELDEDSDDSENKKDIFKVDPEKGRYIGYQDSCLVSYSHVTALGTPPTVFLAQKAVFPLPVREQGDDEDVLRKKLENQIKDCKKTYEFEVSAESENGSVWKYNCEFRQIPKVTIVEIDSAKRKKLDKLYSLDRKYYRYSQNNSTLSLPKTQVSCLRDLD